MRSFSDVGHQVHPTLTARANDAEIDGHHQLVEQIRSDVDFIGTAVLGLWRLDLGRYCQRPLFEPRSTQPSTALVLLAGWHVWSRG